jgi:hypothetical protein
LFIPAQTKTAAAAMEPAVQQMALLAGKTGGVSPLILFWRNLGTMQSVAMGVAVAVIAWAVPVSVQVREWWNRKSEGTGLTARKGLAAAVTPRARVSAGEAGKQMAEVFLTYGFSQDSAFKALELLKQVPGSERLEAVQALLEALPRGSAQSASVTLVLKNFAQDAAWHPKKYPEDILTALELMPRDTTPEFDAIVENHPDVDATVRLYEEIQRRNKTEPRRRLPAFTRAVARALAGRSIPEALAFCRGCVLSGDAGEALEGLMGAADAPAQRKILWEALAAESDRRFQTALLAKLTNAASMAEVGAFVDGLPAGGFHNAAATLLARKQLAAQERDSQPMEVNAVVDAWLARVPAEERMEQLGPLCDNLPYSYDRAEAFYRRLATVFSGADLDQLLGRWVTTFASVSSPPQIAMEALERIADPDVRFSSACEMVTRWAQLSGGENAREQAAEWMHRTFTAEQREAYELLNSKL